MKVNISNIIVSINKNQEKEIYKELEAKFEELGYDSPYEGSNLDQLLTAMSYTTSMLNINTAVNINETLLTLAEKRKNILQDARILGYEASKKTSYKYKIRLKFTKIGKFLIPKYSVFKSNNRFFYYFGPDITVDIKDEQTQNTFRQIIEVKEGMLILTGHPSIQEGDLQSRQRLASCIAISGVSPIFTSSKRVFAR